MIDRGMVIKGLEKVWDAFNHMEHELYADYVFDALAMLKSQPDVVRCGECKYYREGFCYNPNAYETTGGNTVPDWYCADGKREKDHDPDEMC